MLNTTVCRVRPKEKATHWNHLAELLYKMRLALRDKQGSGKAFSIYQPSCLLQVRKVMACLKHLKRVVCRMTNSSSPHWNHQHWLAHSEFLRNIPWPGEGEARVLGSHVCRASFAHWGTSDLAVSTLKGKKPQHIKLSALGKNGVKAKWRVTVNDCCYSPVIEAVQPCSGHYCGMPEVCLGISSEVLWVRPCSWLTCYMPWPRHLKMLCSCNGHGWVKHFKKGR